MHAIHHAKELGIIQFYKSLAKQLTEEDYATIRKYSEEAIRRYFGEEAHE